MTLCLTNTMKRTKEPFVPANPDHVAMYVCGPTVYNFAHIGNARPEVVAAYRNNPAIFPTPETIKASEFPVYLGEEYERLIEETWARIQAA